MGLFDQIGKALGKKLAETAVNAAEEAMGMKSSQPAAPQPTARGSAPVTPSRPAVSQAILDSGNTPAKPVRLIEQTFRGVGAQDGVSYKASFSLSEDFIEFDPGALEINFAAQYDPFHNEEDWEYDTSLPTFSIGIEGEEFIREFRKNGTVGRECTASPCGNMLFRAKADYRGAVMVLYGFERTGGWGDHCMNVIYSRDIEGTALEQKLVALLDAAAASYTEIRQ